MSKKLCASATAQLPSASPLTRNQFLLSLSNLGVYQKNGQRAVHKPLLILLALANVQSGKGAKVVFPEIEAQLQGLIKEFGTTGNSHAPKAHYPFWYLRNDGFWEVEDAEKLSPRRGKGLQSEPSVTTMRAERVRGGFTNEAYTLLQQDPTIIDEAAQQILSNTFPASLRLDVLHAIGINGAITLAATKRDARFRDEVLRAYSYTCVVCGYDGRLRANTIGLEAAHIRWVQFGGPNEVSNGFAMCALHHKIFDKGGLTVEPNGWLWVVSKAFNGLGTPVRALHEINGAKIRLPPAQDEAPLVAHLEWHNREVFHGPAFNKK